MGSKFAASIISKFYFADFFFCSPRRAWWRRMIRTPPFSIAWILNNCRSGDLFWRSFKGCKTQQKAETFVRPKLGLIYCPTLSLYSHGSCLMQMHPVYYSPRFIVVCSSFCLKFTNDTLPDFFLIHLKSQSHGDTNMIPFLCYVSQEAWSNYKEEKKT